MYSRETLEAHAMKWQVDADRILAWHLFSEFFLDTKLDQKDLLNIVVRLDALPFSIAELAHIAYYEVTLVCAENLLFGWWAGEWAGFDNDWLIPRCKKAMEQKPFRLQDTSDRVPHFPWQEVVFLYWKPSEAVRLVANRRRFKSLQKRESPLFFVSISLDDGGIQHFYNAEDVVRVVEPDDIEISRVYSIDGRQFALSVENNRTVLLETNDWHAEKLRVSLLKYLRHPAFFPEVRVEQSVDELLEILVSTQLPT